jgi:hypothetical protein
MSSAVRCTGCGSCWSDKKLAEEKKKNPKLLSCCPERNPLDIDGWMKRSDGFESEVRSLRAEIEELNKRDFIISSRRNSFM